MASLPLDLFHSCANIHSSHLSLKQKEEGVGEGKEKEEERKKEGRKEERTSNIKWSGLCNTPRPYS